MCVLCELIRHVIAITRRRIRAYSRKQIFFISVMVVLAYGLIASLFWKSGRLALRESNTNVEHLSGHHREPMKLGDTSAAGNNSPFEKEKTLLLERQKRENVLNEIEEKLTKISKTLLKSMLNESDLVKTLFDKGKESSESRRKDKVILDSTNPTKPSQYLLARDNSERTYSISSKNERLDITPVTESSKPRKNIIIIAHGRSGSTITGDIFNQHRSVFYLFEPLQTVERLAEAKHGNYKEIEAEVLTNMLRCRFSDEVALDIQYYYNKYPNSSKAIGNLVASLCPYKRDNPKWDPKLCAPLKGHQLETLCRQHYQINVLKILITRISEKSIGNIMEACLPDDIECKFILLVRDPRAIIASSRSVSFFHGGKQKDELRKYSNKSCQQTRNNVLFVKNLPPQKKSIIKLLRYEEFAMNPLGVMEDLYLFTSLKSNERLREWLYNQTHPNDKYNSSTKCKGVDGFCTIDNANQAVNRWRVGVSLEDIMIMESHCLDVMKLLGYKPLEWSKELTLNTAIPLFREEVQARKWFSHHN